MPDVLAFMEDDGCHPQALCKALTLCGKEFHSVVDKQHVGRRLTDDALTTTSKPLYASSMERG